MINNIAPHIINPGYTKHNVIDEGFRISTWARIDRSNMNFFIAGKKYMLYVHNRRSLEL